MTATRPIPLADLAQQWRERAEKIATNAEGLRQPVTLEDFLANRALTLNECAAELEAFAARVPPQEQQQLERCQQERDFYHRRADGAFETIKELQAHLAALRAQIDPLVQQMGECDSTSLVTGIQVLEWMEQLQAALGIDSDAAPK